MSYPRYWQPERVRTVLTTESRQKARELFLSTHRPFQRIRVDFCKEPDVATPFVTESELRGILHAAPLSAHNRLFFVVGEAGSGKSELCQWLEYTADEDSRLPIHIPRSMTTARHVIALLRGRLNGGRLTTAHGTAPPMVRAKHVAVSALMLLYNTTDSLSCSRSQLEAFLSNESLISCMAARLEQDDDTAGKRQRLVVEADVEDICSQAGWHLMPEALAELSAAATDLLERAAGEALWLGDVHTLLTELCSRCVQRGQRPLLLIEDITAFQVLRDVLLDYLLDLSSGHFDAVIGVTTGFEKTQLAGAMLEGDLTHIHHRLRARFVLTDDQGCAYGLAEDVLCFSSAYLRAVREDRASAMPAAFTSDSYDLYPFTETALVRAFSCLREEGNVRQTPRLFLEHVLGAVLQSEDIPSVTLDRSAYLARPPVIFRRDQIVDDRLESLLRWYGTVKDRAVTLDAHVADFFGVHVPPELRQGERIVVPRISAGVRLDHVALEEQPRWDNELHELQHWLDTGERYPSRETLKRGIERILFSLGDPRELTGVQCRSLAASKVVYARGDEHLPMYLEGDSGDVPADNQHPKIEVTRRPSERGILEELAFLALPGNEIHEACSNLALTLEWAQTRWQTYHVRLRDVLQTHLGDCSVEHVIWTGWRMACAIAGTPWNETPHIRPFSDASILHSAGQSLWVEANEQSLRQAADDLMHWHDVFRRLFIGAFMLHDTMLDPVHCAAFSADPLLRGRHVLDQLATLPLRPLRTAPFKIRPSGDPLYEPLAALQRYCLLTGQLDLRRQLQLHIQELAARHRHLRAQRGLQFDRLPRLLEAFRLRCGQLGIAWREEWSAACNLDVLNAQTIRRLEDEVHELNGPVDHAKHADAPNVWAYHDLRHRLIALRCHPYWQVKETLDTVRQELLSAAQVRYGSDRIVPAVPPTYRRVLKELRATEAELTRG